jgi:PilZ domain
MKERRRFERFVVQPEGSARIPTLVSVRVLDVSVAGVLLQSSRPMQIGQRGALRLAIGGHELTTEVAVTRVSATGTESGYRIGAAFTSMAPDHRQIIERFTNQ